MWRYYYLQDETKTIFHSETELGEENLDLIFVGMSQNPNPKMAVAVFVQGDLIPRGYKIKPFTT